MGEFEELDTEEPLGKRIERHAFDRLIMLSDGVFAIAITLAALELRPPDHWNGLNELLQAMSHPLASYLISFLVVAAYWTSQRDLMARLRKVDNIFTALTLAQLFFVALLPTATKLLYVNGTTTSAVQVYSGILSACGFLASGMWAYGTFKPDLMLPDHQDRWMRWLRLATSLLVPVFFTILLLSGGQNISMMIYVTIGFIALRRIVLPWVQRRHAPKAAA